ncbi:MAG: hypothetical protein HY827_00465 [Actinobacteria bacterium]|nr:hypothetical protein [Actinomycetota bacterium]
MNGKVLSATALVALAGLSGVALGTRNNAGPATNASQAATPNVETVVIQRTEHVRKRIKRKRASAGQGTRANATTAAPAYRAATRPIVVNTRPVAPPVRTAPSSTGGEESEGEHELEHGSEGGGDGAERDD